MADEETPRKGFPVTVKIDAEVPFDDVLVLVDMAGYGIGYWCESAVVDEDKGTYRLVFEDPETGKRTAKTLTFRKLARMLVELGSGTHKSGMRNSDAHAYLGTLAAGDPDAGILDSDIGDIVVQLALFDEVVFG